MFAGVWKALSALSVALAAAPLAFLPHAGAAEPQWVKARLGSFEAVSDNGRRSAIQGLSQFEQFRFALGTVMGKTDLRLDPPLRIIVFRSAQEMESQGCEGVRRGRDHQMACITAEGQLPPGLVADLTGRILAENFSGMAPATEHALATFFSTVESTSVHVRWGVPPLPAERTREWALLHMLITHPDYSGRAHIYLHNLAGGMDSTGALRSMGEDPVKFNAAVDKYFAAGVFTPAQAPSRPLTPERDFSTTILTSDEGRLLRADLLTPGSAGEYQALLKAGKQVTEASEGLGLLAMREGDTQAARNYMEAARRAGTKNAAALTSYAALEKDPARAIEILREALTADPKYAPAHWAFGERVDEAPRRLAEWKQAVALAPRNYEWWDRYAQLCVEEKQFAEAGRAWVAAAQSAPDARLREQYLSSRGRIDELRLHDEEIARRREQAAKALEIDRLKEQARREIADLEARANTRPLSAAEAARTVNWDDVNRPAETVSGTLLRVECLGVPVRLTLKADSGANLMLLIPDPSKVEMTGPDPVLACGSRKARPVRVGYQPATDPKTGDARAGKTTGEVTRIEFR